VTICKLFPILDSAGSGIVSAVEGQAQAEWPAYGGQPAHDQYSPLSQINRGNVSRLRVAWTYDSGESGGLEASPIVVRGVLYSYTPSQKVIALDATTGKLLWTFDSGINGTEPDRGLSWWTDGNDKRLFACVMNFLYALDPATGKPIQSFGENGRVDLRKGLRSDYTQQSIALTSPGVVYKDLIIVGGRNPETHPAPPGDIRAFDVRTGKIRWTFHTIPHPGEPGYNTWPPNAWHNAGAANNWAGMSLDEKRGIVYVPTGSAVDDFYGADRAGDDLYADTLLALDAETGKLVWYFQGVHHDIWDRDFPSPPSLLTVIKGGKQIDAVAEPTKQGYLFVFDRVTGTPLFPIKEETVPASTVPGEVAARTQPRPVAPEPFARQVLSQEMLTNRTPEAHSYAVEQFNALRSDGRYVPLSVERRTIVFPGYDGGAEWGGAAVDVKTGVLYLNANEMASTGQLSDEPVADSQGARIYSYLCEGCHGEHREGSPPAFPSLINVDKRMSDKDIVATVRHGKGRMPTFPMLEDAATMQALLEFLKSSDSAPVPLAQGEQGKASEGTQVSSVPDNDATKNMSGAQVYSAHCASCHGFQREGRPPSIPALIGTDKRLSRGTIEAVIHSGRGAMPAFGHLPDKEISALVQYLEEIPDSVTTAPKYRFTGYKKFLDQDGYPAISPPWGTLNAIDVNTGKYLWKIPLGEYPELAASGMNGTGSENYGGPLVTAGGLVFIGATVYDRKFRAFDSRTGTLLWEALLPYSGNATPVTYMLNGKQYVVISAGGGKDRKSHSGGEYVAFSLP
jgi:glucose dehydrogenase/cytochrome c553